MLEVTTTVPDTRERQAAIQAKQMEKAVSVEPVYFTWNDWIGGTIMAVILFGIIVILVFKPWRRK